MKVEIDTLYTTKEAAKLLGISPNTLLNESSARKIAYIPGKPNRYPASAIAENSELGSGLAF